MRAITERSTYGEVHHIKNTICLTTCITIGCGDSRCGEDVVKMWRRCGGDVVEMW
jgi:hypothetical protein